MEDLKGKVIGNYRIKSKLGGGGFADVYLAENIHLPEMLVAIKVAKETSPLIDSSDFRKEAQIISQFRHSHIVRLHDFGLYNGNRPYLVMDYIKGGSLRDKHPRGKKLDLLIIVNYIKQIAGALQYAHNHNRDGQAGKTIHRDIKPDNILWENDELVLLSDFGIAINIEATSYTAGTHEIIGTRAYMSPEHFTGKLRSASDQYSLAIMVYEWLCGELPFTQGDIAYQHVNIPPPPLHDKIAILPAVEEVVMKGLAKKPEDRYESVTKFAQALEEAAKFPGESYYPPHVARAMRNCYFRAKWIANTLGSPVNISKTDATLIKSRRGTEGYKRPFTNGMIYWSERGGAQPTFLGFGKIHEQSGGVEGPLGFPLSEDGKATDSPQGSSGTFQRFEGEEDYPENIATPPIQCGATIYWHKGDRSYIVTGKIGECYERIYGTASYLGFPTSSAKEIGPFQSGSTGEYQSFEGGLIYWKRGSAKAFDIGKDIGEFYHRDETVRSRLGFPINHISKKIMSQQGTIGKFQRFEGDGIHDAWPPSRDGSKGIAVYWSKKYGAFSILGPLGVYYLQIGGARSDLGFPIEVEVQIDGEMQNGTDRWCQKFEGGAIYWSRQFGAIQVIGAIFEAYQAEGGPSSRWGFPKAVQKQSGGLYLQEFEGGLISAYPGQAPKARKWEMRHVPQIVDQVYRQILRRSVEPGGLINYGAKLNRGEKSVKDIVREIGQSPEFKSKILGLNSDNARTAKSDNEKVELSVEYILGRGADDVTKSTCIELVKDLGFDGVISDLIDSQEYSLAFGEDCAPITTSGLAVTIQAPATAHCYYRGPNGHLYHQKGSIKIVGWDDDIVDSDAPTIPTGSSEGILLLWEDMDKAIDEQGFLTSAPAAVSWGPEHLECFYRGEDNRLWHRWWIDNGPGTQHSLGDYLTSAPSVVSTGKNSIDCFYRGEQNHLFYRHCDSYRDKGNWSSKEDLGGFLTSAPSAVSFRPEHLECFYRGLDGGLCHRWKYGDKWDDREDNRGGYLTSAPSVVSTNKNNLYCFYRGLNFHLFYRHWDGIKEQWSEEVDLGGIALTSAPTAVYLGEGNIDCYYRGQDKCLWHRRFDGKRWNAEERLGGILI